MTALSQKDKILRRLKRETLFTLANSASGGSLSTGNTRSELARIIKETMSVAEIKSNLRQYQLGKGRKILPALLISIVILSSLTVGLSISFAYTSPENRVTHFLSAQWAETFERTDFNQTVILEPTNDSGYLLAAGIIRNQGSMVASIRKLDMRGNVQWDLSVGANYPCSPSSIQPTSDRGYIIAGTTYDTTNLTYPWLVKTDSNGKIQWNNTYHVGYNQIASYAQQTSDDGYIMVGYGHGLGSYGLGFCGWLLKTNQNGTLEDRTDYVYYSDASFQMYSGQRTSDGGCIITRTDQSFIVDLLRLDSAGRWNGEYQYPFSNYVYPFSIALTTDGGQIVAGVIWSLPLGGSLFLLKVDSAENAQWIETYQHGYGCHGRSIEETSDREYIVAGYMDYFTTQEAWLARIDQNGSTLWEETYGTAKYNEAHAVLQRSNDEYIFAGITGSDADSRLWLVSVKRSVSVSLSSRPAFIAMTVLGTGLLAIGCVELLSIRTRLKTNSSGTGEPTG